MRFRRNFCVLCISIGLCVAIPTAQSDQSFTDTLIGSGNAISFEFDTSNIGGGPPLGWGTQCGVFVIGATSGTALWYQQNETASTKGYITELDYILASTSMVDGSAITIAISKAQGDLFTTQRNWRLYFYRTGSDYRFLFVIDEDAEQIVWRYPSSGSISLGTVYRHHIEYDIQNKKIVWGVNGVLVDFTALIPGNPQNVATKILGSSGSSDGRNTVFLIDRVMWQEIEP